MDRRAVLAAIFSITVPPVHAIKPEELLLPGSPQVGGDLRVLTHKGKPFEGLNGKYALVYFGTAHSLPVCAVDLMQIEEMAAGLNKKCGGAVVPVFVYPESKTAQPLENLRQYVERPGSSFVGLTGSQEKVFDLAAGYRARYFVDRRSGAVTNHTRFAYLMTPKGRNLAIVPADVPVDILLKQILGEIRQHQSKNAVLICGF